jgi:hypothetical protein
MVKHDFGFVIRFDDFVEIRWYDMEISTYMLYSMCFHFIFHRNAYTKYEIYLLIYHTRYDKKDGYFHLIHGKLRKNI